MASSRRRVAVELDARCAPLLRLLDRAAKAPRRRPDGNGLETRAALAGAVAVFGMILDRIEAACARLSGTRGAPPADGTLRRLRSAFGLGCSFYDEALSILAAHSRLARGQPHGPLTLRWASPVPVRALVAGRASREAYVEWRRVSRLVRVGEILTLAPEDRRAIARTLLATAEELRAQVSREGAGEIAGAVRLAEGLPPPRRWPAPRPGPSRTRGTPVGKFPTLRRPDSVRARTVP